MERKALALSTVFVVVTTLTARPAVAQEIKPTVRESKVPPQQKPGGTGMFSGWELDVHVGGSAGGASSGGLSLPAPGPNFVTFNGFLSRQVRSWFFGDGVNVLNQNLATTGLTPRITPLDTILNAASVSTGVPFGVRLSRGLTPRLGFEFAFDFLGSRALTSEARDLAERTRSTFVTAWEARTATMLSRQISANLEMSDAGMEMLTTGALTYGLPDWGRLSPYAVIGGGVWSASGAPTITLDGDYRFVSGSNSPYRQTDHVEVAYRSGSSFATLLGAGFRYALNSRSGIRVDFRGHFAPDPSEVIINWRPTSIPGTPTNTIFLAGTPPIQVSMASLQSTLSLTQAEPDLVIASADGMRKKANFTFGYYYRFGEVTAPAGRAGRAVTQKPARTGKELWQSNRVWEFDVHGGGAFGNEPGASAGEAFPVGAAFNTPNGRPSRYASTWMFGDGAAMINQIAAGFTSIPVIDRMSPLDSLLRDRSLERSPGGSIGARASRRLSRRLRAEFAVTASNQSVKFTEDSVTRIEATRASFAPVWNGLIATGGGVIFTNGQTSATAEVAESVRNWQTAVTGSLEMQLWTNARSIAYATFGAGIMRRSSSMPEATLTGSYQFLFQFPFSGTAPLSERDVVRVHYDGGSSPLFLFGGGYKYFLSSRRGIRADFQFMLDGGGVETLANASPSRTVGSPEFSIWSTTNPSLVFSNGPALRGNLTGPAIVDLVTSTSGRSIQMNVTVGYFFRF